MNEEWDIMSCARGLYPLVALSGRQIKGPVEISRGFGDYGISYWTANRRFHLYQEYQAERGQVIALVIAELDEARAQRYARRLFPETLTDVQEIFAHFMRNNCEVQDLGSYAWSPDKFDHDKQIPDPPDRLDASNLRQQKEGAAPDCLREVLRRVYEHDELATHLGLPVVRGLGMRGAIFHEVAEDYGTVNVTMPLWGTKNCATARLVARKFDGLWSFAHLEVSVAGDDTPFDLRLEAEKQRYPRRHKKGRD